MGGVVNIRARAARQSDDVKYLVAQSPDPLSEAGDLKGKRRYRAMLAIPLVLLTFAGWCQHFYTCFNEGQWGFLVTGAVMSPIGIINGWGIWLSWW